MTSAPCNSQFLVSIRSDGIAICPMVVGDDGLYRNLQDFKKKRKWAIRLWKEFNKGVVR